MTFPARFKSSVNRTKCASYCNVIRFVHLKSNERELLLWMINVVSGGWGFQYDLGLFKWLGWDSQRTQRVSWRVILSAWLHSSSQSSVHVPGLICRFLKCEFEIWREFPLMFVGFLIGSLISGKACLRKKCSFETEEMPTGLIACQMSWDEERNNQPTNKKWIYWNTETQKRVITFGFSVFWIVLVKWHENCVAFFCGFCFFH